MVKKIVLLLVSTLMLVGTAFAADDLKSAFTEGKLKGEFRNYYFERDYDDRNDRKDIASGGMLYYQTSPLNGISAGFAFYTGQAMGINDSDDDVYGLLAEDGKGNHESFSVLGEAYVQADFWNTTLKLGRQELEVPFVNTDDNRLTPQSTEAYTLINKSIPDLKIMASYVKKMRGKAETDFVSMSEYAGIEGEGEPVIFGGLVYDGVENLTLALWDFYAEEFFNGIYLRADYSYALNETWGLFTSAQYLNQQDTGDKIGGSLDTYTWAVEAGVEVKGFQFSLAYADVGDQEILIPWGHDMIVSIQVNDCVRAEETGILAAVKYDFAEIGIDGLVAKVKHLDFDTPDSGINASPDKTETDFDVIYKFGGWLDGLSLRLRHAIVDKEESLGGEDYNDSRAQLKYDFNIK